MKFYLTYRGSPLEECESLVHAYVLRKQEFKKRWPQAFYGPQEASAHGLEIVGKPEITPEEAREMRDGTGEGGMDPKYSIAAALRKGF